MIVSEDELETVKKYFEWNSCVSGYYSVVNKLKVLGIIEKKSGNYFLSKVFSAKLASIKSLIEEIK